MRLTDTENKILRAMARVAAESRSQASVVVLRYALLEMQRWDDAIEFALCNDGMAHPLVADLYNGLCRLVLETELADGRGHFKLPAGPRCTEAWITPAGQQYLARFAARPET